MNAVVLDSSVIIAILKNEPGAKDSYLHNALVSTVNLTEVATRLITLGYSKEQAQAVMSGLPIKPIAFDLELVNTTAFMVQETRKYGLSLGDRACLTAAIKSKLPVLTADRIWKKLETELNVQIQLIR